MANNIRITQLFQKYSEKNIRYYLEHNSLGLNQLTEEYLNDPYKKNILLNNLVKRIIDFRNSLVDPCKTENTVNIQKHKQYFYSPYEYENSQIRGPQLHISQQMFSDFGFAGNLIELSGITASSLENLTDVYARHVPSIVLPKSFSLSSPHSFRQGIEATAAKMHSGATGQEIYLTDDNSENFPPHDKYINNMPKNQKIGDFVRVIDNHNKIIAIEEDVKTRTLGKIINKTESGVYFVGAVDIKSELESIRIIAEKALNNSMPINAHILAIKNNPKDITLALQYVAKTGKIEDANQLLGFPHIMSNRHNDPSNQV